MIKIIRYLCIAFVLFFCSAFSTNNSHTSCNTSGQCEGSLTWQGLERTFVFHLPPSYSKNQSLPLILALHGTGGTGEGLENNILAKQFDKLADKEEFIIVYPNGFNKTWNNGRGGITEYSKVDDVGFIQALIDFFVHAYHTDPARTYVTGMSSGGFMAHRLACESADKIAAIAPVIASMPKQVATTCSPGKHISVLMINGTKDPLVPWNRHEIIGFLGFSRGERLTVPETLKKWVTLNAIESSPVEVQEVNKINDGIPISKITYRGKDNTEVILYTEVNAGHTWPEGEQYLPVRMIGRVSQNLNATSVIWEFFKRH